MADRSRAAASLALDIYMSRDATTDELGEAITDLIADLAHLADAHNYDGSAILNTAALHFNAEREGR